MKFIRKNGRIIPIKDSANAPSKKKMDKNYKKYGDGANQSARIMTKYEQGADKATIKNDLVSSAFAGGTLLSLIPKNPNFKISGALMAGMIGSMIYSNKKKSDYMKKNESNIESDHVKAFGVGSAGEKVQKMKKLIKKKKGSSV